MLCLCFVRYRSQSVSNCSWARNDLKPTVVSSMSSVRLVSRIKPLRLDTLPPSAIIHPPPSAAVPRKSLPTLVGILAARQSEGGPTNLRVEEFKNEKREWHGVKRATRKALAKAIQEK